MNLPENPSLQSSGAKGISRRAFTIGVAGVIGSMFLEPVLGKERTFWLPGATKQAYADEVATVTVSAGQFSVVCCGPEVSYMGFNLFGAKRAPVIGVTVRVRSLYNGKEVETKSDENGVASFDLEPLGCKQHSDSVGDFWEFDACITIDPANSKTFETYDVYQSPALVPKYYAPDYRQVVIPRIHILAGSAIQAPMVDVANKPYFRSITFDDWDIQYNNQEFVRSSTNDAVHTMTADLYFPAAAKYSVQPVIAKSDDSLRVGYALASAQVVEGGAGEFKTIKFAGAKYLCDNGEQNIHAGVIDALYVGDVVSLVISDPSKSGDDAKLYTVQTGLSAFKSPCGDAAQQGSNEISPVTSDNFSYGDGAATATAQASADSGDGGSLSAASNGDAQIMTLSEGNPSLKAIPNPTFHLPSDNMPDALKNLSFSVWAPSFPVVFRYDPAGSIVFGLDIELFNYSNAPDVYTGDTSWRSQPRQSFQEQCDRKEQLFKNKINQYKELKAAGIANGKNFAHKSFGEVSLSGAFQMLAQLDYDTSKKLWSGDLSLVLGASVNGSFTVQFVWCGFPFYVKFELWASLSFGASWALESGGAKSGSSDLATSLSAVLSGIKFVPNSQTTALTFQIGAAVTLAAGVDGIASAGVRGSGGVSFAWQWRANATTDFAGKSDPRLLIGAHVEVALFGELFGFRASWTAWSGKWPSLYDSDASGKARAISLAAEYPEGDLIEPECSCMQPGGDYYMPENDVAPLSLYDGDDGSSGGIDFGKFTLVSSSELAGVAEISAAAVASGAAVAMLADVGDTVDDDGSDGIDTSALMGDAESELVVANDFTSDTSFAGAEAIAAAVMRTSLNAQGENGIVSLAASNDACEYSWIGGHEGKYDDRGSGADVIYKLGDRGGVLPRHMNLLAKDVFSASHSKLIDINGARYLFRIAPVKYGENARTRVVYQRITDTEASLPYPVEYEALGISASRESLYDYNFDVRIVGKEDGSLAVLLLVISGERPSGDDTTIFDAAEATVATAVRLGHLGVQTAADQGDFATKGSMSWQSPAYDDTKKYYAFRAPKLMVRDDCTTDAFDRIESDGLDHELGFYIVERADTKEELLVPGKGDTGICVVHFSFSDESYDAMELVDMGVPSGTIALTPDSLQNAPSDAGAVFATLGYKTHNGCGVRSLKLGFEKNADDRNVLKSVNAVPVIDVDASVKGMCPWDDVDTLIAIVANDAEVSPDSAFGYFARVALPSVAQIESHLGAATAFSTFTMTCVSTKSVPLQGLSMRSGHKYCYYASNHSGVKGYDFDDEGAATSHIDDASYHIKAFAEANGVFTKPFILAQCDHPIDSLFAIEDASGNSHSKTSFVARHVTSAASSKADLYAFDVPFLRSISVDSAMPVSLEVVPGESNSFTVTVTNSGNTVLTQAKLQFIDADAGKTIGEATLNFKEATNSSNDGLYQGIYYEEKMSSDDLSNILVAEKGDAVLVPGQTRSFVMGIDIPEDWSGTKKLTINADSESMSYIDPNTGKEVSSGAGIALYDGLDSRSVTVEVKVASSTDSQISFGDLTGELVPCGSDDGSGNGGGSGSSGSGGSGGKKGSASELARTGDGVLSPAVAAVAAAGAGLAAYSARRTRLERQAESGEGDEE